MDLLRAARDRYQVEALTANTNVQGLAKLAREFGARFAAVADPDRLSELKDALAGTRTECARAKVRYRSCGTPGGLGHGRRQWCCRIEACARGCGPRRLGCACQQGMPCLRRRFLHAARRESRACILPADSEHNALFQALGSGNREELVRVIITASGGPFRTWASADIEQATLAQALKHPNWSMDRSHIDSASMMNKGLEVIEASYLFALTPMRSTFWCIRSRSSTAWSNFRIVRLSRSWGRPICARRSRIASDGPIASSVRQRSSIWPKLDS